MGPLENPAGNPCFGCGPAHARGLRLAYEVLEDEEGAFVRTSYVPREDEVGWPGLFHTGLQFLVLFDASYWAALTLSGKVHVSDGPQVYDQTRLPRVGKPFEVTARLAGREPLRTIARSVTKAGKPCASLETAWKPASRAALARAGVALPEYLLDEMDA